jgi:uncharacterized protein (DUF58 family)
MDWKVTARTRKPHVRVYAEDKDRTVLLIVDQRQNMFFGTKERLKSVTAAKLAALAAWRAIQQAVMQILGHVVEQNHALSADSTVEQDPAALNRMIERARVFAPHDALVVLITDGFGANEQTERVTARLVEHNDVLGFLVHDPWRFDPEPVRFTASDGDLQMEVDFSNSSLRQKVAQDYRQEHADLAHHFRRMSAPLLTISNQGDVVAQVRRLLGVPGGAP